MHRFHPQGRPHELRYKPRQDFIEVNSIEDLLNADVDAVFWLQRPDLPYDERVLNFGKGAGLFKVVNAKLYPPNSLDIRKIFHGKLQESAPKGISMKPSGAVLLTGDHALFSESFRRGYEANRNAVSYDVTEKKWYGSFPEIDEKLAGKYIFGELASGHFGHALVDMPGRYWTTCEACIKGLRGLPYLATATHGLTADWQQWPDFFRKLILSFGLNQDSLHILENPVVVEELFVPSRVAPFQSGGGLLYNSLMKKSAAFLCRNATRASARRIYLSRSRLGGGFRRVAKEPLIEKIFSSRGFEIFHAQEHSLEDQVAAVRQADRLAGIVGSQLHLAAFCESDSAGLMRIVPSYFQHATDRNIMRASGGSVRDFIVDISPPIGVPRHRINWDMSLSDLDRLEEAVDNWLFESENEN